MHLFNTLIAIVLAAAIGNVGAQYNNDTSSRQKLLTGGILVTYNTTTSSVSVLRNASILIQGGQIIEVSNKRPSNVRDDAEIIILEDKIITPGFVDTHRHGWQTAFRTIGSNTTLVDYFVKYGSSGPASTNFTAEDIYVGQLVGIYEALNTGVTSILDFAHHTWSTEKSLAGLQASVDSGARVWWSYAIQQLSNGFSINEQFEDLEDIVRNKRDVWGDTNIEIGLAYDGFAGASSDEVERALNTVHSLNLSVITTHYNGPPFGGDNSPTVLEQYSALNTTIPVVFAHARSLTLTDANILRNRNQFISITPESEHHYGHDQPNSWRIQDQASLGIDTHFTFSTDLITQARLWLQATRLRMYKMVVDSDWNAPSTSAMSVNQAFILATYNGGQALRRNDIGIIAPGAKADLAIFKANGPGMVGSADPVAAVILHSNVGDVEHVLVNGEFVKRDGKLVGVDWAMLVRDRFLPSAQRIQNLWAAMDWPQLAGEFAEGVDYEETRQMDVLRGKGTGY